MAFQINNFHLEHNLGNIIQTPLTIQEVQVFKILIEMELLKF